MVDLNELARKKALFIDNAATASQNVTLVDDAVTREAIELSVIAPLIVEISERDQRIATLEAKLADMLKADETRARDISRLTVERDNALSALEATPPAPKVMEGQRTYYIDCEFDGHGGQILSMALVSDDGRGIYLCVPDMPDLSNSWVEANIWPLIHMPLPIEKTVAFVNDWGALLRAFLGDCVSPLIIADSPVDIGRICHVLTTGSDGGWSSTDFARMQFEVHNVDCYPTELEGAVQHNAWWDAMALRARLTAAQESGQ